MSKLSHVDDDGKARMVDVGDKPSTRRRARARGRVKMGETAFAALTENRAAKGDVLAVARIAGIAAAKRTGDLIPLCHPLPLEHVSVSFMVDAEARELRIEALAAVTGKTGIEMEAITAVSVAALTVYDMLKAVDREISITDIELVEKSGGRSGEWRRK